MRPLHSSREIATLVVPLLLAACTADAPPAPPPLYTTRDSAGITILDYRVPDSTELERWEIIPGKLLIGHEDQGPDNQLRWPRGLTRMTDGRIVVALSNPDEVRVFDSTGRFVRRISRAGPGPGEFSDLESLARINGDTLAIYNRYPERVMLFGPDGEFVRASRLVKPGTRTNVEFPAFEFHGFYDDGTILLARHPGERRMPPSGVKVDSTHPLRTNAIGAILADYGKRWAEDEVRVPAARNAKPGSTTTLPYSRRRADWGRTASGIFYTTRDRFEIELWTGDGRLTRIVRLPAATIRKTAADSLWVTFRDEGFDFASALPDTLSPINLITVDRAGNLWVAPHPRAFGTRFWSLVFDSSGVLRARVTWAPDSAALKRGMRGIANVGETGDDYILGIMLDSMDVPYVRISRLVKHTRTGTAPP